MGTWNKKDAIRWVENENGCWICTSHCKSRDGYPLYTWESKQRPMSKFMYELRHDCSILSMIDGERIVVCHKCDTPGCINPNHLFLGTQRENVLDMVIKERQRGAARERNPHAKLTSEQVIAIRKDKRIYSEIAKEYGIKVLNVSRIKRNLIWKEEIS